MCVWTREGEGVGGEVRVRMAVLRGRGGPAARCYYYYYYYYYYYCVGLQHDGDHARASVDEVSSLQIIPEELRLESTVSVVSMVSMVSVVSMVSMASQ